jgi:molybdopterin-guanine dinucleotide biosynthesis protein A
MGTNKALLRVDGRPLIDALVEKVRSVTDEVFISSNEPSLYAHIQAPVIEDMFPGQGPISGLHAAMLASSRDLFLVVACDLPCLPAPLLRTLIRCSEGFDAVIPCSSDGRPHPLCATYRRSCLPYLEFNLTNGQNQMIAFLQDPSIKTLWLGPDQGGFSDAHLYNLNTPADLALFRRKISL